MGNKNAKKQKTQTDDEKDLDDVVNKLTSEMKKLAKHKAKYEINDDGSVTFYPTPGIKSETEPLQEEKDSSSLWYSAVKNVFCDPDKIEALSSTEAIVKINNYDIDQTTFNSVDQYDDFNRDPNSICSFITASLEAWSKHYPFRFKPEHIWLLILQSVALHVDQNAEILRNKYVLHDAKKQLIVVRDDFEMGSPNNDWKGVIDDFVVQIDKNAVKDTIELFECDFTCSTLIEKVATKVTIMDICKNYFEYELLSKCGFPQITLDGTKQDWMKLKVKCTKLLNEKVKKQFGAKWSRCLLPTLDKFIQAFDGRIDCVFWNSMIKRGGTTGSGACEYFTGWFNVFIPIIQGRWNYYCEPYSMHKTYVKQGLKLYHRAKHGDYHRGGNIAVYPSGLSAAPVVWKYHQEEFKLKFIAGFMGFKQDAKTLEICPQIGWCIAHEMNEKGKKKKKRFYNKI